MWIYQQSTGNLTAPDGTLAGVGYSGNGADLNNPAGQGDVGHGPIPQGFWLIGEFGPHVILGPESAPLSPVEGNDMDGRDGGFFIHGDNEEMNHTASDGCIILGPALRKAIAASGDVGLKVIA
jgi:hypothetical protein